MPPSRRRHGTLFAVRGLLSIQGRRSNWEFDRTFPLFSFISSQVLRNRRATSHRSHLALIPLEKLFSDRGGILTRSRVGRQIGTVHEAKPGRCVDDGAGFRVAPRQSSQDAATRFAGGLALPPRRHKPAAPADGKRRMAVAFIS